MDGIYFQRAPARRSAIFLFSLLFLAGGVLYLVYPPELSLSRFAVEYAEFQQFMADFNKSYGSDLNYRFQVYSANKAYIQRHNAKNKDWKLGINKFSDLTFEEFQEMYLSPKDYSVRSGLQQEIDYSVQVPKTKDWRDEGAVTPIRDQGQCGSCWSFSAAGTVESAWFIKNKSLISLSTQQLVDCSWDYGNMGCQGGLMDSAYMYIRDNGITSEENYPYTAFDGYCHNEKTSKVAAQIKDFVSIESGDWSGIVYGLMRTPVAVAVEANEDWMHYSSGVITENCDYNLNHGVIAVGYNFEEPTQYWIIKNSWGKSWGEDGYIRLGISQGAGVCGINIYASFPLV